MSATLQATQLSRVRTAVELDPNDNSHDQELQGLVDGVSVAIEQMVGNLLSGTVTEERDVEAPWDREVWLWHAPVSSITSVKTRAKVSTTWANATTVTATNYVVSANTGRLVFDVDLTPGPLALQVVYVAGFAATTAALVTAYPEIAQAADMQVAHMWRRRHHPGAETIEHGGVTSTVKEVKLLDTVKLLLMKHTRPGP